MNRNKGCTFSRLVVLFAVAMGGSARAEMQNVAAALDYVGFELFGQRNPLSTGIDFLATSNFDGALFDFGAAELTLNGPLSLQVSTGGRLLSVFDVSLTTAVTGRTDATPLSYEFNSDSGPQTTQVSGTVLADMDFSLNRLGFYDLSINYSSRQEVIREGEFADDSTTNDYDLGPIDISGNIYADVLALLTDPIFEQSGQTNPFDQFSGRAKLSEILLASATDLQTALGDGSDPSGAESNAKQYAVLQKGFGTGDTPPGIGYAQGNANGTVVPEPAVLVLMLLGIPSLVLRRPGR